MCINNMPMQSDSFDDYLVLISREQKPPSDELTFRESMFVIFHFLSFMFSIFSFILLLSINTYTQPIINIMIMLSVSSLMNFLILIIESRLISDKMKNFCRAFNFRIYVVFYHISWIVSLCYIPLIVYDSISYPNHGITEVVFWAIITIKVIVETGLIIYFHLGN
jgi:hypothetical protein